MLKANTSTAEMSLSYPSDGIIDGRPLDPTQNLNIVVARHPLPLPNSGFLNLLSLAGQKIPFSGNLAPDQQAFVFAVEIGVPVIKSYLFYDPDVSIRLLFVPPDDLPPAASGDIDNTATNLTTIIIVSVVVPVVALIAIVVFARFVFPYLKARQESSAQLDSLDDDTTQRSSTQESATWKAARASTA